MNKKILVFDVLVFALIVVVGLSGCKKDKPVDTPESPEIEVVPEAVDTPDSSDGQEKAQDPKAIEDMMKGLESQNPELSKKLAKMLAEAEKQNTVQTQCPVMSGEIKKDIFVEYKGQKVYFCCPPCKKDFNADPEKYITKLPQFKK